VDAQTSKRVGGIKMKTNSKVGGSKVLEEIKKKFYNYLEEQTCQHQGDEEKKSADMVFEFFIPYLTAGSKRRGK
jgi:hypothetical protein